MARSNVPLTAGGKMVAVAGALFLLDTFAPWHRLCVGVLDVEACRTDDAWATSFSSLAAMLVLALVAEVLAVQVAGVRPPELGQVEWGQFRLAVSALATGLVLMQLMAGDGALDRSFGIFAGLLLSAGLTYGNYLRAADLPIAAQPGGAYR